MVDHLRRLGMRVMVSSWAFVLASGARASGHGDLVVQSANRSGPALWPDLVCDGPCYLYDPSKPETRAFVLDMLQSYIDAGVRNFWFDSNEPENIAGESHTINGVLFHNPQGQPAAVYAEGTNEQVG